MIFLDIAADCTGFSGVPPFILSLHAVRSPAAVTAEAPIRISLLLYIGLFVLGILMACRAETRDREVAYMIRRRETTIVS